MKLFAVGVGGSGSKCLEAVIHLHTMGLFDQEGISPRLGVLFVEPDRQSALLQRAQTALVRTRSLRQALDGTASSFCQSGLDGLKDYDVWNPVETVASQGALTMARIYTKEILQHNSQALGGLMDCLFTQAEQQLDLREGFRGRPPIGSALMSATALDDPVWGRGRAHPHVWKRVWGNRGVGSAHRGAFAAQLAEEGGNPEGAVERFPVAALLQFQGPGR